MGSFNNNLGSVYVEVGADLSGLAGDFQTGVSMAGSAGQEMGAALENGLHFDDNGVLRNALGQFASEGEKAAAGLGDAAVGAQQLGNAGAEAEGGLKGMAEQLVAIGEALVVFEGLKELAIDALTTFGNVEKATIALTALTGSAETANTEIESLKELALTDALSFPALLDANQRMTAFGVAAEKIPAVLQATADAAAAMNTDFDTAASKMERIVQSGMLMSRSLVTLGINMNDVAAAMGISAANAAAVFKELDISDRVDVIVQALAKYQGQAELAAKGISGQWQDMKTAVELAMEDVGKAIAPVASEIIKPLADEVAQLAADFTALPDSVKEGIVILGGAATAVALLTAAVGALGIGLSGLKEVLPLVTGLLQTMGVVSAETAGETAALGATLGAGGVLGLGLLSAGAAIGVTLIQLNNLQTQYASLDAEIRSHDIFAALSAGKSIADLQAFGYTMDQIKAAIQGTSIEAVNGKQAMDQLGLGITTTTTAAQQQLATDQAAAMVKALDTDATKLLTEAATTYASYLKSSYVPVVEDVAVAEMAVTQAKKDQAAANAFLQASAASLQALIDAHSNDIPALIAAYSQLAFAQEVVHASDVALADADKTLTASRQASTAVTASLAAADKEYTDLIGKATDEVVKPYAQALDDVTTAKGVALQAAQNLQAAEEALRQQMIASYYEQLAGIDTSKLDAAAQQTVTQAYQAGQLALANLAKAEKDANTSRTDYDKIQKTLIDDQKQLNDLYAQYHTVLTPLPDDVQAVVDASNNFNDAYTAEAVALQAVQDLQDQEDFSSPDWVAAKERLTAAQLNLKGATDQLHASQTTLTADWGISAAQMKELITVFGLTNSAAIALGASLESMGVTPMAVLANQSKNLVANMGDLNTAFNDGLIDSVQYGNGLEALYNKQVALAQQAGTDIPAAQQIMFANLNQQLKDYASNATQLWTNLYNTIHGDVETMFQGLFTDVFNGGGFLQTMEDAGKKMGEAILATLTKPLTDLVASTVSDLLTKAVQWVASQLGISIGSLPSNATLQAAASTLQAGATTLQTAAAALQAAAGSLQGAVGGTAAGGAAGDAGGGAGGAAGEAAGAVSSGLTGILTSVFTGISAITGVLNLLGVGVSGDQLDRLNRISNDTGDMDWVMRNWLGPNSWAILAKLTSFNDDGFWGWFHDSVYAQQQDLDEMNASIGPGLGVTMGQILDAIKAPFTSISVASPAGATGGGVVSVNVYLDGQQISSALSRLQEEQYALTTP